MLEESIFSFYITDDSNYISALPVKKTFGKYNIFIDKRTPYDAVAEGNRTFAVLGIATNVLTGDCNNIAKKALANCSNVNDVVNYEKQLGGKYILLCKLNDSYYILGDATCSIPLYYNVDSNFHCSSNYILIKDFKKYSVDEEYSKIRNCGDLSQAMPYDITPCREIKQLLPNHYLKVQNAKAVRYVNATAEQPILSIDKAVELISPMIRNLTVYYSDLYKIYCPITAGRDSRVVLSSLLDVNTDCFCYTIKHGEHSDADQDIVIPSDMCSKLNVPYELIHDVVVTDELIGKAEDMFGKKNYSTRTLRIAQTIKEHYADGAIINGDIVGQVGKCSLHRDIPRVFATPSYFRCKLHNYSSDARKQLKLWLNEIKNSGEKVNTFDLFSVENRMGRWAGQENLIYNSLGVVYLNIFNSRSIIYALTAVKRNERKLSLVHKELINQWYPALNDFPYKNTQSKLIRISKANGMNYLLSSYVKYYMDKKKFFKDN